MKRLFLSALTLWLATSAAMAESIGPFTLDASDPQIVYLDGGIEDGAGIDFAQVLKQWPGIKTLVLNSDGGYVDEALLIAREVSRRQIDTYVAAGQFCYSACAYVFFAGDNRKAVGELGVHQISGDDDGLDVAGTQSLLADLLDAMNDFGVDHEVIFRMLRTRPESMYVFTAQEIAALGIDRTPNRDFAELVTLDTSPAPEPGPAGACRPIKSLMLSLEACVASEWVESRGTGAQEFLFGTADDAYGLMLVTEREFFSHDEFRDAIIQNAVSGAGGSAEDVKVLGDRRATIDGVDFDQLVYSVQIDGMPLMFQNNYYSDPDFGSLQIIAYSLVTDSFAAAVRMQTFLSTVKLGGETAPEPTTETPRLMDQPGLRDQGLESGRQSDLGM